MRVSNEKIQIRLLFMDILTIPLINIKKITTFKNSLNIFKNNFIKIEYNMGTKKNEVADIRMLNRESFLSYMSQFSGMWEIEEKEKFTYEKDGIR